jgi:hypothetical protein
VKRRYIQPFRVVAHSGYDSPMSPQSEVVQHTGLLEAQCTIHPGTPLICPRCLAAKGGRSRSPKKLKAIAKNAKLASAAKRRASKRKK